MEKSREPIRVLQINSGDKDFGGVSSFLYNVYRTIDTDIVQFDFLSPNHTTYSSHAEDITGRGANIFELGIPWSGFFAKYKYCIALRRFLDSHYYEIAHINSGNFVFCFLTLFVLKKSKIKKRIVHSHSVDTASSVIKTQLIKILKKRLTIDATDCLAPSDEAANFMFKCSVKKPIIIKDGIFIEQYSFDETIRTEVRKEMGFEGKFVLGHVGRFETPKNHRYLLKSILGLLKDNMDIVLCCAGSGSLESEIRSFVLDHNIEDKVIFLGERNDINRIYQGLDCFLFPSLYEGLGMALVEAQIAGLPCIISDRIPSEAIISDKVIKLPIDDNSTILWEKAIRSIKENSAVRHSYKEEAIARGYSIESVTSFLLNLYLKD